MCVKDGINLEYIKYQSIVCFNSCFGIKMDFLGEKYYNNYLIVKNKLLCLSQCESVESVKKRRVRTLIQ